MSTEGRDRIVIPFRQLTRWTGISPPQLRRLGITYRATDADREDDLEHWPDLREDGPRRDLTEIFPG